jgi:UDP-2-acetamido-3-amino-2,3-dideoxy-glucuronate N-acetyltransferase
VHASSYVDDGAQVGAGTKIWHFCHVLGRRGSARTAASGRTSTSGARSGDGVRVQNNVSIYDGVTSRTSCSAGRRWCSPTWSTRARRVSRKDEYRPTLGAARRDPRREQSTVVWRRPRSVSYCFVAAGAVVRGDVARLRADDGVPARRAGGRASCGVRLAAGADLKAWGSR